MLSTKIVSPSSLNALAFQNLNNSRLSSFSTSSSINHLHPNFKVFVPKYQDADNEEVKALSEFVNSSKNLLAITGN